MLRIFFCSCNKQLTYLLVCFRLKSEKRLLIFVINLLSLPHSNGEVSEWLNEQTWKVCVRDDRTEGSNPSLSANVDSHQCLIRDLDASII